MDSGQVFVLVISVFAIGILAYLEFRSRRAKSAAAVSVQEPNQDKS